MLDSRVLESPRVSALLEWGVASRPMRGESVAGDSHVLVMSGDLATVAVVDGLGHGVEAAEAARRAAAVIERGHGRGPIPLVRECHSALIGTRGVTMSLAHINCLDETMTWMAIGNVEGLLVRADGNAGPVREAIVMRGGVVGYDLPMLRATTLTICRGDLLVFATDGVDAAFSDRLSISRSPQQQAEEILAHYGTRNDDALVLVARYLGREDS